MLKANEINPNVSEQDSAGSEHDEENNYQNPEGVKILKGLTMEVCEIIQFSIYLCSFYFVGASFDLHFNLFSTSLPLNHFHIAGMQVKTK